MNEKTKAKVTPIDQEQTGRDTKGRFAKGNPGGPGGARPGSGRKPKPDDPTLLNKLYTALDEAAPKALKVLSDALGSKDEKTRVKAAALILAKVLPDKSMLDLTPGDTESDSLKGPISPEEAAIIQEGAAKIAEVRSRLIRNEPQH